MTQKELDKIVKNHQHWLNRDCKDWKSMKADLRGANLEGMNLRGAVLRGANLDSAKLCRVNLSDADLASANMRDVNLWCADLRDVNLKHANLYCVKLRCADLAGADLSYANLGLADLRCANLSRAFLCNTNLEGARFYSASLLSACLKNANLKDAVLSGANFNDTFLNDDEKVRKGVILKEKIIGYKKTEEGKIIELEIPKGAIVFSINKEKCRTNKAIVKKCKGVQHSNYDKNFEYVEGKEIEVEDFNLMYNIECGAGIHFFRTKKEAEKYACW